MKTIEEITILQLQEMYMQKEISVKEVVEEYLKRIAFYDQGEDKLNSILEINPVPLFHLEITMASSVFVQVSEC